MVLAVFIFGLIVGSFLNCVIYRSGIGLSYITGRSMCPKCKHQLSWKDNIPLISFLLLKGKCRYCRKKISLQYPLVELSTAILFTLAVVIKGNNPVELITSFWIIGTFLAIFMIDLLSGIIPDELILAAIIVSIPYSLILVPYSLITAFVSFLVFFGIYLITSGKGMGFGDVKLALLIGFILGFPSSVFALYLAFLTGALAGVILIISHRKKIKQAIPFGPFLCFSCLIFFFFGNQISSWLTAQFF